MKFIKFLFAWCLEAIHGALLGHMQRSGMILYAAHTGAASFTDTIYAISAGLPASYDASGYGATTITWTTIGKVESFPEFGSTHGVLVNKKALGVSRRCRAYFLKLGNKKTRSHVNVPG